MQYIAVQTLMQSLMGDYGSIERPGCVAGTGTPNAAHAVAPTSANVARVPSGRAGNAGENIRIGTISRVWSLPGKVGSRP